MTAIKGCHPFPDCTDRALCRGSCERYMQARAAEVNELRARIARLGNKKSRQQAAEREAEHGTLEKTGAVRK